jgi:hypothetical protein
MFLATQSSDKNALERDYRVDEANVLAERLFELTDDRVSVVSNICRYAIENVGRTC